MMHKKVQFCKMWTQGEDYLTHSCIYVSQNVDVVK
jgi:hypothetical protein